MRATTFSSHKTHKTHSYSSKKQSLIFPSQELKAMSYLGDQGGDFALLASTFSCLDHHLMVGSSNYSCLLLWQAMRAQVR